MRFRYSLLAALITGLVMAPSALSATDPTPAAQGLSARTAAWVAKQLHVPVPARTLRMVPGGALHRDATVTFATDDLAVEAPLLDAWAALAERPTIWSDEAAQVLLHETLHLRPSADPLNEGAVDAVALDMVPAWVRAFLGSRPPKGYGSLADASYPSQVKTVRALSVAATGLRWRSRAARLWRRAYLVADDLTRVQMIEATR